MGGLVVVVSPDEAPDCALLPERSHDANSERMVGTVECTSWANASAVSCHAFCSELEAVNRARSSSPSTPPSENRRKMALVDCERLCENSLAPKRFRCFFMILCSPGSLCGLGVNAENWRTKTSLSAKPHKRIATAVRRPATRGAHLKLSRQSLHQATARFRAGKRICQAIAVDKNAGLAPSSRLLKAFRQCNERKLCPWGTFSRSRKAGRSAAINRAVMHDISEARKATAAPIRNGCLPYIPGISSHFARGGAMPPAQRQPLCQAPTPVQKKWRFFTAQAFRPAA